MTIHNGLSDPQGNPRRSGSKLGGRRGSAKALTVDHLNVVEIRRSANRSDMRWVGRLLCYTSAILSLGLAVAFGLTLI